MTVLDFYLVRHGQSFGQTGPQRPPDCETGLLEDDWRLTPLGQRQAALLGESLSQTPFDMVFCSPLERARATAQAVAERQPRPVPLVVMPDLTEFGDYGPESIEEFHARARRVAGEIRGQSPTGSRILVVAHGGLNNALLGVLLGVREDSFRFAQDNTGVTRVTFHGEDTPEWERVRLCFMNDLRHLTPELRTETIDRNMKELRMTPERMKEIHRQLIDALNHHSSENIEQIFHDNYTVHEGYNNANGTERCYPVSPGMLKESMRKGIPGLPDKRLTVKMQIAEGDMVFSYCIAAATHSGPWLGVPATGKRLTYENLYISRFENDKIAEHWVVLDAFGMLRQMEAL